MSIRYYPSFRVKTNLNTAGNEFQLNGAPYTGKYYATFDGKFYAGANPIFGSNERLLPIAKYINDVGLKKLGLREEARAEFATRTKVQIDLSNSVEPTSYQARPTEEDYSKGYFFRFFVKKVNEKGYIKEISEQEFVGINSGTVPYDVSYYQTESVMWKLTGPLNTVRLSQYDIRAGIIDTNKRLVETKDVKFLGLKTFIGEEYAKFSRAIQ